LKRIVVIFAPLFVLFLSANSFAQTTEIGSASFELLERSKVGKISQSIAERLINDGADVNVRDKQTGASPLMLVASHGPEYKNVLDILVKNNADVNAQDNDGRTAIMYAAMNFISRYKSIPSYLSLMTSKPKPNFEDLRLLIDLGADLYIRDNEGRNLIDRISERVTGASPLGETNPYRIINSFELYAYEVWEPTMLDALKRFEDERVNKNNSVLSQKKIDSRLEYVEVEAKRQRNLAIRQNLTFYTYGVTGINVSEIKLVDDFLSKILLNFNLPENSDDYNYALSYLLNEEILNFLENIEVDVTLLSPSYLTMYRNMLTEIKTYKDMKTISGISNPRIDLNLKNQRTKTLKAIRIYRTR
jgi:hypothetical protein